MARDGYQAKLADLRADVVDLGGEVAAQLDAGLRALDALDRAAADAGAVADVALRAAIRTTVA